MWQAAAVGRAVHPAKCPLLNWNPACVLQLLPKLQDKRAAVERECAKLPGAPKAKDIFQLCRGFERPFSITIEVGVSRETCGTVQTDSAAASFLESHAFAFKAGIWSILELFLLLAHTEIWCCSQQIMPASYDGHLHMTFF